MVDCGPRLICTSCDSFDGCATLLPDLSRCPPLRPPARPPRQLALQDNPQHTRQTLSSASKLTQRLLAEFEAAPWLLPAGTPALPYAGVHGVDELLALRSRPAGSYNQSITLLLFNTGWATMAQNSSECNM